MKPGTLQKTVWLFPVFFMGFSTVTNAQQWSPLYLNEKFNYRIDTASYITNSILVDSVKIENSDSVFYLNRIVTDCPSCPHQNWKLYNQPQFLKKKMIRKPNNVYIFSNPGNFYLKTLAGLYDLWIFDSTANITAQVVSKTFEQVLNTQDSVKTINLSNGQSIKLSKNHGIIQFPVMGESYFYQLEGIAGRNLGTLIPVFTDFFNFNIGNVFQYAWWYMSYATGDGGGGLSKITINSKDSSVSGYIYGVTISGMHWYESMIGFHGDTSHTYFDTTIVYTDSSTHPCNLYPRELINDPVGPDYFGDNAAFMKIFQDTGQFISRQYGLNYAMPEEDPVYIYGSADTLEPSGIAGFVRKYTVGLGEVIYRFDAFESSEYDEMIGYVKNGDTTGIVYSDEFILQKININYKADKISVFPNPAHQSITLGLNGITNEPISVELYTFTGQKVFSKQMSAIETLIKIDVSSLQNGLFFLKVVSKSRTGGKVIILQ